MYHTTTRLAHRASAALSDVHVRRALAILALPLALALIGALASVRSAPSRMPATAMPIIQIVATPTAIAATPAPASRAIVARWDYRDAGTATAIESADIVRLVGRAEDWRLVALANGAQVWLLLADVPIGTAMAGEPLADLAPSPTPIIVFVEVPAPLPAGSVEAGGVRVQTTIAPACWAGPPAVYVPGQDRCWAGVPFQRP